MTNDEWDKFIAELEAQDGAEDNVRWDSEFEKVVTVLHSNVDDEFLNQVVSDWDTIQTSEVQTSEAKTSEAETSIRVGSPRSLLLWMLLLWWCWSVLTSVLTSQHK